MSDPLYREIEVAVGEGDSARLEAALAALDPATHPGAEVVAALQRGIEAVRIRAGRDEIAVAELVMAAEVFRRGLELCGGAAELRVAAPATAVIGVVRGDIHDMGKNLVATVLAAAGHQVVDLGYDVGAETFVEAAVDARADLVALSTMMSTTVASMADIVGELRRRARGVAVLVGGAALDAELAAAIGAHGYAANCGLAPEQAAALLRGRASPDEP